MLKYCSKCKEEKNFEKFYKCKVTKDGFCTWCKKCFDEKSNKQYNKNKENGICVNCRSKSEEGRIRCRFCAEKNSKRIKDYRKTERGKEVIARIQRKYRRKCYDSDIQFRIVKVLRKSFLPGAGFTTGGVAKQGKTSIHGVIEVTNYARGGEALSPQDVGLTTLDHIDIKHREELMSSDPGGARRQILYSYAAQQFYVIKE